MRTAFILTAAIITSPVWIPLALISSPAIMVMQVLGKEKAEGAYLTLVEDIKKEQE